MLTTRNGIRLDDCDWSRLSLGEQIRQIEVEGYLVVRTGRMVLQVTPEHPFYVGEGMFKTIEALHVGDEVYAFDGRGLSAQKIEDIQRVTGKAKVYNLQTDFPNTFFAAGVAVHNKGGGCVERGTMVPTPSGLTAVEQLKPGDSVWAVAGGSNVVATVQAVTSVAPDEYCELTAGGRTLRVTGEHPIEIAPGVFRVASRIRACSTAAPRV